MHNSEHELFSPELCDNKKEDLLFASANTEEPGYIIHGYIIQPSGYIGHFERCEREHLRA